MTSSTNPDAPATPPRDTAEWYSTGQSLSPTTPVNLGAATLVFELQSDFSDVYSLASWYRVPEGRFIFQ